MATALLIAASYYAGVITAVFVLALCRAAADADRAAEAWHKQHGWREDVRRRAQP